MKAQAKKMNVESLKSGNDQNAESAEMKIAKVKFLLIVIYRYSYYRQVSVDIKMKNHKIKTECPDQQNWY